MLLVFVIGGLSFAPVDHSAYDATPEALADIRQTESPEHAAVREAIQARQLLAGRISIAELRRRMDGIADCRAAYRWILEHGPHGTFPASELIVGGDSSGGNLALATMPRPTPCRDLPSARLSGCRVCFRAGLAFCLLPAGFIRAVRRFRVATVFAR